MTETPSTASQIRTGHVFATPYAPRHKTLEVAWTIRERFTNPEGRTLDVVWFAGWERWNGETERGAWVARGWGQPADGRVWITDDTRGASWGLLR
jgi:hypothetical protein